MGAGNCPSGHTADLVEKRLSQVDEETARLESLRSGLVRLRQRNDACPTSSVEAWSCRVTIPRKVKNHDLSELRLRLPVLAMLAMLLLLQSLM